MKRHLLYLALLVNLPGIPAAQEISVSGYRVFETGIATSIRAIDVLSDSVIWFSGSGSIIGCSRDGGHHWMIDTMETDSGTLDLRLLAVLNDHTVITGNAGTPAFLFKTDDSGDTWKTIFENDDPEIFLDCIRFQDSNSGIVVGDPILGCFQLWITHDGGETFKKVPCASIPESPGGEVCFASSNSSCVMKGKMIWLGTGRLHSQIYISTDGGLHWKSHDIPLAEGGELTGAFSIDFFDATHGVAAGGDYTNKASTTLTLAVTDDLGKSWAFVDEANAPPFVSCIQYHPKGEGNIVMAACLPGIYFSEDAGHNWNRLRNEKGKIISDGWFTFRISPTGKTAWFAGPDGKLAVMELNGY